MSDETFRHRLPDIQVETLARLDGAEPGFMQLDRRRIRVRYPDGTLSEPLTYDSVTRVALDAVVILAHYTAAGRHRVYLRSAVRPPVAFRDPGRSAVEESGAPSLWELPAGLVEKDEETSLAGVVASARRELLEEVGFDVPLEAFAPLGRPGFPAPGFIAERHYFYEVRVDPAQRGEPRLDGSALERHGAVIDVPLDEALEMCRQGEIEDEKTELALRRLKERLG
jgi:ADP-ribose pyrophosphatase